MYPRGKHVLIVEDDNELQQIDEVIVRNTTRWPTIAKNGDEATAILRSTLHPLIVMINAGMRVDGAGYGSLLLNLLANPDFASTHAFIVQTGAGHIGSSGVETLREEVARLGVGFVAWLDWPTGLREVFAALKDAEAYVLTRA